MNVHVSMHIVQDNSSQLQYQHFLLQDKAATVEMTTDAHEHADGRWYTVDKADGLHQGKVASRRSPN